MPAAWHSTSVVGRSTAVAGRTRAKVRLKPIRQMAIIFTTVFVTSVYRADVDDFGKLSRCGCSPLNNITQVLSLLNSFRNSGLFALQPQSDPLRVRATQIGVPMVGRNWSVSFSRLAKQFGVEVSPTWVGRQRDAMPQTDNLAPTGIGDRAGSPFSTLIQGARARPFGGRQKERPRGPWEGNHRSRNQEESTQYRKRLVPLSS